jgi:hypothetical protein
MNAVPMRRWNTISAVGVGVVFTLLLFLAPQWYKKQAELQCLPDYAPETVYPDMSQCGKAMEAKPGGTCRCSLQPNPWAGVYVYVVLPVLVALTAALLFEGSVALRIGLVNASIWGALLTQALIFAVVNPVLIVGLALSLAALIHIALVATVVVGFWAAFEVPTVRRGKPGVT